jgi:light-regulated signal transduction histidine kinase (bacteriophytochrome)
MEEKMKKIIVIALATIAIATTALIAVPALAKESPAQTQVAATNSLYMGYGAAFCGGGLALGDEVTLQRVAATLGITYDQLVQRLQNGETIAAIATAQKVALSKVVDTIVAAQTDMVNVLLKYGYITQDQANTIIANLRTHVEAALLTTTPAAGYGCHGYSPDGSRIEVKILSEKGTVTVSVADHGQGIPAENLPLVFERFYRVDRSRSRSTGGSGLGLAIAKQLIEAQGGSIRAESKPGAGSTFSFTLSASK